MLENLAVIVRREIVVAGPVMKEGEIVDRWQVRGLQFEETLVAGDSLFIVELLAVAPAEIIKAVGMYWIEIEQALVGANGHRPVSGFLLTESEIEQGVGIPWRQGGGQGKFFEGPAEVGLLKSDQAKVIVEEG